MLAESALKVQEKQHQLSTELAAANSVLVQSLMYAGYSKRLCPTLCKPIPALILFLLLPHSLFHNLDEAKSDLVRAAISSDVPVDEAQGWEELTVASVAHLLSVLQRKGTKDVTCKCQKKNSRARLTLWFEPGFCSGAEPTIICFVVPFPPVGASLDMPENISTLRRLISQLHERLKEK